MAPDHDNDDNDPLIETRPDIQRPNGEHAGSEDVIVEPHRCSNFQAMMNLIKANIGTGLLGLPFAVMHAGLLLGPLSLFLMSVICVSCMYQLCQTSKRLTVGQGARKLDYAEVAQAAMDRGGIRFLHGYGFIGSYTINVFLMITQLGFCCVYFIFMADNIQQIYQHYYEHVPDVDLFILMLFVPVMLICFIRNWDEIAPLSALAIVLTVVGIVIVYQYLISYIIEGHDVKTKLVADDLLSGYPYFFGSAIFAFEGIGVVLPVEMKMRNPEDFNFVLILGMSLVTILYISMGFLGYLAKGDQLKETITLNLPQEPFYLVVKMLFVAAIFVTYAVQFYVPAYVLWPFFMRRIPERYRQALNYVFRAALVLITMLLAISIPELANFITLIGAFSSSGLALIFPPMLEEMVLSQDGYRTVNRVLRLVKNVAVFLFGLLGMVVGTYTAIKEIVHDLHNPLQPTHPTPGWG